MVWDIDSPFTLKVVTACLVVLVSVNKMINECDNFRLVLYGFDFFFGQRCILFLILSFNSCKWFWNSGERCVDLKGVLHSQMCSLMQIGVSDCASYTK